MELYGKMILHFFYLQDIVIEETAKIFQPILKQVERQGEEVLLFPPVRGTLWTEWLVKPPEGIPTERYRHLLLIVQAGPLGELTLVLAERYAGKPDELDREIFTEHYRAGRIDPYEWDPYFDVIEGEADDEEERKEGLYVDYGLDELARFPLKGKIKAKEIAERIVLEAQKIHEEQTALAIECRKQCAKRRARVRQKQASVPDTPTPTN